MDVGLTKTSTPSPTAPPAPSDKPEKTGESERRPVRAGDGVEPRRRADDTRVAKIDQLERMAEEAFAADDLKLSIQYDKAAGRFVYRGLDRETGEVVREYPAEEVLERIARAKRDGESRLAAGVALDRSL